ncbi:MAG: hypothetical protein VYC12_05000 [Candidatus Thermoplasmatota archaeon]|nr:hypothetical protein [Candidatus Thermoplasmatota archaeon]
MGLFGDFLDLIGLGDITGVDVLFAAMAIVGTFLFIIYFLLILIGDFTGGMFDFEMDADGIFHLFTIQGLLSFIMMFGIFGLSVSQADQNAFIAIIAGTIAGTFSMYIVGKVFQMMASLEKDNTVEHAQAIGARGTVYRTIHPGKMGEVQVEYQGALRTESAVAKDETLKLETGKFVEVVDVITERLIVIPLDINANDE